MYTGVCIHWCEYIVSLEFVLHEIAALAQPPVGGLPWLHSLKYCSLPLQLTCPRKTGTSPAFAGPGITTESEQRSIHFGSGLDNHTHTYLQGQNLVVCTQPWYHSCPIHRCRLSPILCLCRTQHVHWKSQHHLVYSLTSAYTKRVGGRGRCNTSRIILMFTLLPWPGKKIWCCVKTKGGVACVLVL